MKEITLTAVFEGTIYNIDQPNTHLYQVLHNECKGTRIKSIEDLSELPETTTHLKMGFNGCGVDYGFNGTYFGSGIEEQATKVAEAIKTLIKKGYKVNLNAIGLSRGGIAAIRLAKILAHIDSFHLETNLLLLDPVPGNLLITPMLDFFNYSLANRAMDLSDSKNLKYVETLYPYLEVSDETENTEDQIVAKFQAPIRPTYPSYTEVREEVILGAHLSAFQDMESENKQVNLRYDVEIIPIIRRLSRIIIHKFLSRVGSLISLDADEEQSDFAKDFECDKDRWNAVLKKIIDNVIPKNRALHSEDSSQITITKAPYLNKTHRELIDKRLDNPNDLCLKVTPERTYAPLIKFPLTKELLLSLIIDAEKNMTLDSKGGSKGLLLTKIKSGLNSDVYYSEEQLSFLLRDILTVVLQRDRNSYSFYGSTTSGLALVETLNKPKFIAIKQCIRPGEKLINYSDLTTYVLGSDSLSHFNSNYKEENLDEIDTHQLGEDGFRVLLH